MAITDRTRKILWTRAGNRCAIGQERLTHDPAHVDDDHAVLADECHIVARRPGGARYGEIPDGKLDSYENLILLCKVHHKQVDDQPAYYTSQKLREIKAAHEQRVDATLDPDMAFRIATPMGKSINLQLTLSGRQLLPLVGRAYAYEFSHDEPENEDEAETVGGILQDLADYGDIWDDIGPAAQVRDQYQMTKRLEGLLGQGLVVFAGEYTAALHAKGVRSPWPVAVVVVRRINNIYNDHKCS